MPKELVEDTQRLELEGHYRNPYRAGHNKVHYREEAGF